MHGDEIQARIFAYIPGHRRADRCHSHGAWAWLAARRNLHGACAVSRLRVLLLAPMLLLLGAAAKPMLVPDVSQRSVEIYYSFSGAELLLFGAIIYPEDRKSTRLKLQSLMRISYAVFCLKKKNNQ